LLLELPVQQVHVQREAASVVTPAQQVQPQVWRQQVVQRALPVAQPLPSAE
jgi:hypothetical protein